MKAQKRLPLCRADLLRVYLAFDEPGLVAAAGLLGYDIDQQDTASDDSFNEESILTGGNSDTALPKGSIEKPVKLLPFFRVKRCVSTDTTGRDAVAIESENRSRQAVDKALDQSSLAPVKYAPLAEWSQIWPLLHHLLSRTVRGHRVDIKALSRELTSLRPLKQFPFKPLARWKPEVEIWLDLDDQLLPFHTDMDVLTRRLIQVRGEEGVLVRTLDRGPYGGFGAWPGHGRSRMASRFKVTSTLLLFSDLGCYDQTGKRMRPWLRLGHWLKQRGCHPIAFVPCPSLYWPAELGELYRMYYWDRQAPYSRQHWRPVCADNQPISSIFEPSQLDPLLVRLASFVRIEPYVLRIVRLCCESLDVSHEAAIWLSTAVSRSPVGFEISLSGEDKERIDKLFRQLPEHEKLQITAILDTVHQHLSEAIYHEEKYRFAELTDGVAEQAERYFLQQMDKPQTEFRKEWISELCQRTSLSAHRKTWFKKALQILKEDYVAGKALLPENIPLAKIIDILDFESKSYTVALVQDGAQLVIVDSEYGDDGDFIFSKLLAEITVDKGIFRYQLVGGDKTTSSVPVKTTVPPENLRIGLPIESQLILETRSQVLTIEAIAKPNWAKGIAKLRGGLAVDFENQRGSSGKAIWMNPGIYPVTGKDLQSGNKYTIEEGFFWDKKAYADWLASGFVQPEWAEAIGVDDYGLYADWTYKGVTQRFRWISPGEFLMGSAEKEKGRFSDEFQHRVVLTQGYWLADTACTQALWQVVMGDNPSYNKGENKPVDKVSWDDTQAFIQAINQIPRQHNLRLPTEAEWEYACRAMTSTPFSFGETITPEQVNYDGNHPYLGDKKERNRGKTVEVKSLPCNNWGLYEMRGNVMEWCQDRYGQYPTEEVVNPTGSDKGKSRVLRGGSWIYGARSVRSASRYYRTPDFRYYGMGFRLARG